MATYDPKECGSPNGDTFACAVEGMGKAMTKTMRDSGIVAANGESIGNIGEEFLARGTAFGKATFVRAQWHWIGLPFAVWLLGVVTWVAVAMQTREMELPL